MCCVCIVSEGEDPVRDTIRLHNRGGHSVAYRIRVSVQNRFVLRPSEGVLDAGQSVSVSVILKGFPSPVDIPSDGILAKFAVEFLECDDSYYVMGVKSFWLTLGASCVTKKLLGRVVAPLERPAEPAAVLSLEDSVDFCMLMYWRVRRLKLPSALRCHCASRRWCARR